MRWRTNKEKPELNQTIYAQWDGDHIYKCVYMPFKYDYDSKDLWQIRDSRSPGIRLTSTTGFHERDYVMVGDELDQLVYIADQPDEDVRMRSADGLRWALMGTSPDVHAVNTPVYDVEILPPGAARC